MARGSALFRSYGRNLTPFLSKGIKGLNFWLIGMMEWRTSANGCPLYPAVQAKTAEPAVGEIEMNFFAQAPLRPDGEAIAICLTSTGLDTP
jgi:hypothetical protein